MFFYDFHDIFRNEFYFVIHGFSKYLLLKFKIFFCVYSQTQGFCLNFNGNWQIRDLK